MGELSPGLVLVPSEGSDGSLAYGSSWFLKGVFLVVEADNTVDRLDIELSPSFQDSVEELGLGF